MSECKPFPSTNKDFDFLARSRRMRWFCLFRAVRDLLHAETRCDRERAEAALLDAHDRLLSLGVTYRDEALRAETPESQEDVVRLNGNGYEAHR